MLGIRSGLASTNVHILSFGKKNLFQRKEWKVMWLPGVRALSSVPRTDINNTPEGKNIENSDSTVPRNVKKSVMDLLRSEGDMDAIIPSSMDDDVEMMNNQENQEQTSDHPILDVLNVITEETYDTQSSDFIREKSKNLRAEYAREVSLLSVDKNLKMIHLQRFYQRMNTIALSLFKNTVLVCSLEHAKMELYDKSIAFFKLETNDKEQTRIVLDYVIPSLRSINSLNWDIDMPVELVLPSLDVSKVWNLQKYPQVDLSQADYDILTQVRLFLENQNKKKMPSLAPISALPSNLQSMYNQVPKYIAQTNSLNKLGEKARAQEMFKKAFLLYETLKQFTKNQQPKQIPVVADKGYLSLLKRDHSWLGNGNMCVPLYQQPNKYVHFSTDSFFRVFRPIEGRTAFKRKTLLPVSKREALDAYAAKLGIPVLTGTAELQENVRVEMESVQLDEDDEERKVDVFLKIQQQQLKKSQFEQKLGGLQETYIADGTIRQCISTTFKQAKMNLHSIEPSRAYPVTEINLQDVHQTYLQLLLLRGSVLFHRKTPPSKLLASLHTYKPINLISLKRDTPPSNVNISFLMKFASAFCAPVLPAVSNISSVRIPAYVPIQVDKKYVIRMKLNTSIDERSTLEGKSTSSTNVDTCNNITPGSKIYKSRTHTAKTQRFIRHYIVTNTARSAVDMTSQLHQPLKKAKFFPILASIAVKTSHNTVDSMFWETKTEKHLILDNQLISLKKNKKDKDLKHIMLANKQYEACKFTMQNVNTVQAYFSLATLLAAESLDNLRLHTAFLTNSLVKIDNITLTHYNNQGYPSALYLGQTIVFPHISQLGIVDAVIVKANNRKYTFVGFPIKFTSSKTVDTKLSKAKQVYLTLQNSNQQVYVSEVLDPHPIQTIYVKEISHQVIPHDVKTHAVFLQDIANLSVDKDLKPIEEEGVEPSIYNEPLESSKNELDELRMLTADVEELQVHQTKIQNDAKQQVIGQQRAEKRNSLVLDTFKQALQGLNDGSMDYTHKLFENDSIIGKLGLLSAYMRDQTSSVSYKGVYIDKYHTQLLEKDQHTHELLQLAQNPEITPMEVYLRARHAQNRALSSDAENQLDKLSYMLHSNQTSVEVLHSLQVDLETTYMALLEDFAQHIYAPYTGEKLCQLYIEQLLAFLNNTELPRDEPEVQLSTRQDIAQVSWKVSKKLVFAPLFTTQDVRSANHFVKSNMLLSQQKDTQYPAPRQFVCATHFISNQTEIQDMRFKTADMDHNYQLMSLEKISVVARDVYNRQYDNQQNCVTLEELQRQQISQCHVYDMLEAYTDEDLLNTHRHHILTDTTASTQGSEVQERASLQSAIHQLGVDIRQRQTRMQNQQPYVNRQLVEQARDGDLQSSLQGVSAKKIKNTLLTIYNHDMQHVTYALDAIHESMLATIHASVFSFQGQPQTEKLIASLRAKFVTYIETNIKDVDVHSVIYHNPAVKQGKMDQWNGEAIQPYVCTENPLNYFDAYFFLSKQNKLGSEFLQQYNVSKQYEEDIAAKANVIEEVVRSNGLDDFMTALHDSCSKDIATPHSLRALQYMSTNVHTKDPTEVLLRGMIIAAVADQYDVFLHSKKLLASLSDRNVVNTDMQQLTAPSWYNFISRYTDLLSPQQLQQHVQTIHNNGILMKNENIISNTSSTENKDIVLQKANNSDIVQYIQNYLNQYVSTQTVYKIHQVSQYGWFQKMYGSNFPEIPALHTNLSECIRTDLTVVNYTDKIERYQSNAGVIAEEVGLLLNDVLEGVFRKFMSDNFATYCSSNETVKETFLEQVQIHTNTTLLPFIQSIVGMYLYNYEYDYNLDTENISSLNVTELKLNSTSNNVYINICENNETLTDWVLREKQREIEHTQQLLRDMIGIDSTVLLDSLKKSPEHLQCSMHADHLVQRLEQDVCPFPDQPHIGFQNDCVDSDNVFICYSNNTPLIAQLLALPDKVAGLATKHNTNIKDIKHTKAYHSVKSVKPSVSTFYKKTNEILVPIESKYQSAPDEVLALYSSTQYEDHQLRQPVPKYLADKVIILSNNEHANLETIHNSAQVYMKDKVSVLPDNAQFSNLMKKLVQKPAAMQTRDYHIHSAVSVLANLTDKLKTVNQARYLYEMTAKIINSVTLKLHANVKNTPDMQQHAWTMTQCLRCIRINPEFLIEAVEKTLERKLSVLSASTAGMYQERLLQGISDKMYYMVGKPTHEKKLYSTIYTTVLLDHTQTTKTHEEVNTILSIQARNLIILSNTPELPAQTQQLLLTNNYQAFKTTSVICKTTQNIIYSIHYTTVKIY